MREPCPPHALPLLALVTLLAACGRGDAPRPSTVATTSAVTSSESAPPAASPLFTYEEGGSALFFWSSGAVRLVMPDEAGERTCDSALGDKGNLWTRDDVRAAFEHLDVQAALSTRELYRSAYPTPARLVTGAGTVTWVIAWKELPPNEPEAVHHLHEVLHGVLTNRLLLCR